jgi:hypothetical protein
MCNDYGLAWAENQYDRQDGPNPFSDEWGYIGESEDDDAERSRLHTAHSKD